MSLAPREQEGDHGGHGNDLTGHQALKKLQTLWVTGTWRPRHRAKARAGGVGLPLSGAWLEQICCSEDAALPQGSPSSPRRAAMRPSWTTSSSLEERGVCRVYDMFIGHGEWKLGGGLLFDQRFIAMISEDGNTTSLDAGRSPRTATATQPSSHVVYRRTIL